MADTNPLSDDEVETFLHEQLRQLMTVTAATPLGRAVLRLRRVGDLGALLHLERVRSGETSIEDVPGPIDRSEP